MDTDERLIEFAENIPYGRLFDKIREVTGLGDLMFEHEVATNYRGDPYIEFSSQDITDRIGFLDLMIKSIYIGQFNSEVKINNKANAPYWWGTVAFRYEHHPCGSNGHTFMTFWYDTFNGWTFVLDKEGDKK